MHILCCLRPHALCCQPTEQVQELELAVDRASLDKLLEFLSCSFMGGTDVDKPLQLSLERLASKEWQQVRVHVALTAALVTGGGGGGRGQQQGAHATPVLTRRTPCRDARHRPTS